MARIARSAMALGATFAVGATTIAVAGAIDAPAGCGPAQSQSECLASLLSGSTPTLQYGNSGSDVLRAQTILSNLGFEGPQTGFFGPATKTQVQAYQTSRGLAATGVLDADTWTALREARTPVEAAPALAETIAYSKPLTSTSPSLAAATATSTPKTPANEAAKPQQPTPVVPLKSLTVSSSSKLTFPDIPADSTQAAVVAFAKAQIGKPYQFGSTGPNSFDCSGLTSAAWRSVGVSIPRVSSSQASLPRVDPNRLEPGDLIINNGGGHVMLYIGGGLVIEAYRTGMPVHVTKLAGKGSFVATRPSY